VEQNTYRILELLEKHCVSGTFFVLGWVAERFPQLVRHIASLGHEIACHGYGHQKIYNQDSETFRQETLRSKGILEDTIGLSVIGYRAASFSITSDSLWALDIIGDAGFQYDSSIYPVWHDNYGIPGAALNPSRLQLTGGRSLIEFPLSTLKLFGVPVPVGGGGYFRLYPYWLTRRLLDGIASTGRPINFYCHPWEIDPQQPRFSDAPWRSRFRHYNNLAKFRERLDDLLLDFKFETCRSVLEGAWLVDVSRGSE
jgi:polysaccharide deacetylase family protein (PEP-CTERM system associated)